MAMKTTYHSKEVNMITQTDEFLDWCKQNPSFRARQAEDALGFGDVRKKISDLRKLGIVITDEWVETRKGRCKVYHYEGEA